MRILLAGQIYAPAANGQAVFTSQLAQGLAARGHRATVVVPSFGSDASYSHLEGVDVYRLHSINLGNRLQDAFLTPFPWFELKRAFDASRPQVVHIQDHYPLSRWVYAMARFRGLPVMGTNHFLPDNIIHYLWPFRRGRRLLEGALWWTMTSLYRRLDLVTTPTATAARILGQHLAIGAPIQAISCGVDVQRFNLNGRKRRRETRRALQLPLDKPVLGYVGRIDREKHLDVLLKALSRSEGQAHLAVVGVGRWGAQLRRQCTRLGLDDRVTFTGFVDGELLPQLLAAIDVFVMPSPAELQSIATLEAMAAGKPILAARARALPELVDDGVNGALFETGNPVALAHKLDWLLDQSARWPQMGQASRQRVAPHAIDSAVEQYSRLYSQLALARAQGTRVLQPEEGLRLEP